ncbi:unnamed protein product [Peniophora sp. CBMAI 1063]|nr:unnamed protein product [Peniophora sp. CBMAI 1063]
MSSISMLVTELQALSSETRRKHPDVSSASERALSLLRTSSASSTPPLSLDAQTLLAPILLGLQTRQAKPAALALAALQRAVLLKLVPSQHVPALLSALNDAAGGTAGVDIQLRVLQTLLNLLTAYKDIYGPTLASGLRVAFKLHESRTPVVASTAAATLRQLVMHVLDKLSSAPRSSELDSADPEMQPTMLADGSTVLLGSAERDAHALVMDLCLLSHGEPAVFLGIQTLPRTFALELVESVLTNYAPTFLSHAPLLLLLRAHLCPTLHRALAAEKPGFALTVRATRVVFLLLKQFSRELEAEAEVFLVLLTRSVGGEDNEEHAYRGKTPVWMRVLALEVVRGLCADGELMRALYMRYDGASTPAAAAESEADGPRVVAPLAAALHRLVSEKPALLGVCAAMLGTGSDEGAPSGGGGGGVAGMVSGVVGMMGGEGEVGLSVEVGMRVQCIDQLDKADAPPIPEAYPYLLGTQALVALVDAQASYALPIYNQLSLARPREPGDPAQRAPPALDPTTLPASEPSKAGLCATRGILQTTSPALLPALSYLLTTSLSATLFGDVLSALSSLTTLSGSLSLPELRDAALAALAHTGVPPRVRAALDSSSDSYFASQQGGGGGGGSTATPRTASFSEALGMAVGLSPAASTKNLPGDGAVLGERNLACLRALVGCAARLAGGLGGSWGRVLEAVQVADGALERGRGTGSASRRASYAVGHGPSRSVSMSGVKVEDAREKERKARHPMLDGADPENVRAAMDRLFDASTTLSDDALTAFINALCALSASNVDVLAEAESVGYELDAGGSMLSVDEGGEAEGGEGESTPSASASMTSLGLGLGSGAGLGTPTPKPRRPHIGGGGGGGRGDEFALSRLGRIAQLNITRLVYRPPGVAWDPLTGHLLSVVKSAAGKGVRVRAAGVLDEIIVTVARTAGAMKNEDDRRGVQGRVVGVLGEQVMGLGRSSSSSIGHESSADVEIRRMGLESLHAILQASAHTLLTGWDTIFEVLASVCRPPSESQVQPGMPPIKRSMSLASTSTFAETMTDDSAPPSPVARTGTLGMKRPPPLGGANERGYSALIKSAFQSLTLVCDALSVLSPDQLRLCISTLGAFGRQADTNIALTAAESLFWGVSDAIQAARRTPASEPAYSALWMHLLLELAALCSDGRPSVRGGAIQTLFRTLQLYGGTLSPGTWSEVLEGVAWPLLGELDRRMRGADGPKDATAWAESKVVALQSLGGIVAEFLKEKLLRLPDFEGAWAMFVRQARDAFVRDATPVPAPALRCLERALRAAAGAVEGADEEGRSRIEGAAEEAWGAVDAMGARLTDPEPDDAPPLTQDALVALIDVISATRSISRALSANEEEWSLPRLTRALAIIKGALTYTRSPDFRADVDALAPLQLVVLDAAMAFEAQKVEGAPSVLIGDIAEYATLAFLGAFDAPPPPHVQVQGQAGAKGGLRVTYVALCKKALPLLVQLFGRFKSDPLIWSDGTLERVLAALAIPIKLRYECPAAFKYARGEEERRSLWKRATESFLAIVRDVAGSLEGLEGRVERERVEGVWRAVVDGFRGAILADCSPADAFPFAEQEEEAMFDLRLVAALEADVVPHLGDTRIPDALVSHLARILAQGSKLRSSEDEEDTPILQHPAASKTSVTSIESDDEAQISRGRAVAARERFAYWCFDLLFLISSDVQKDNETARRRVAALSLPALLDHARNTLDAFVADAQVRGTLPFPRAREEELLYVLEKILALKLWPGSFASSAASRGGEDASPNPISTAISASPRAHLFALYTPLVEIAAHQRPPPAGWARAERVLSSPLIATPPATPTRTRTRVGRNSDDEGEIVRRDARELARECLRAVGREMGVPA